MVIVGNSNKLRPSIFLVWHTMIVRMHAVDSRTATEISGERVKMVENELETSIVVPGTGLVRGSLYMIKLVAPLSNRTLKGGKSLRAPM